MGVVTIGEALSKHNQIRIDMVEILTCKECGKKKMEKVRVVEGGAPELREAYLDEILSVEHVKGAHYRYILGERSSICLKCLNKVLAERKKAKEEEEKRLDAILKQIEEREKREKNITKKG